MTTTQIASYADMSGLAAPDIDLQVALRRAVLPAFLDDVGPCSWRRRVAAISMVVGVKTANLPADFGRMTEIAYGDDPDAILDYIGEDPAKIVAAEVSTQNARPTGYYYPTPATIKFNAPPDKAYTAYAVYQAIVPFADDTTPVELDTYIPSKFQWGLVTALRTHLYLLRYGLGDPRYDASKGEYMEWLTRTLENPELAPRRRAVFAE